MKPNVGRISFSLCMDKPELPFSVSGKVVVITGGVGMLGKEYAAFLSARGARVACGRRRDCERQRRRGRDAR